ncbi:MAG: AAA family ATPase [Firmicutes bacterium]|jgi:predicted ATPase|nr:AAA family ATPase [Bacillota bacterium]
MEYIYFWSKNCSDAIEEKGINLSCYYNIIKTIIRDKKSKIDSIELEIKNSDFPHNFYGDSVSSIIALVGENGTGKTSFIDSLIKYSNGNKLDEKEYFFILLDDTNTLQIIGTDSILSKLKIIQSQSNYNICNVDKTQKDVFRSFEYVKFSHYFTSYYSKIWDTIGYNTHDLSTNFLFRDDHFNSDYSNRPTYTKIRHHDILCIHELMMSNLANINTIDFIIPDRINITIRPKYSNLRSDLVIKHKLKTNEIDSIFNSHIFATREENNFSKLLIIQFIYTIGLYTVKNSMDDKNNEFAIRYLSEFTSTISNINTIDITDKQDLKSLSDQLLSQYCPFDNGDELVNFLYYLSMIELIDCDEISRYKFSIDRSNISYFQRLLALYKTDFIQERISFEWLNKNDNHNEFSSGQENILILYARIYKTLKTILEINQNNKIVILLDEPCASFHPNWERRFISDFIKFLESIKSTYPNMTEKFQLVITTNTPFIISSIPSDNIITLSKTKSNISRKTFGANIHTLLKDSFFMTDTIGEFAKQKIKAVTKDLLEKSAIEIENEEGRKEEIEFIIDNIGEPIIQRKLQELYNNKFNRDQSSYEKEISELKYKLNELEKSSTAEDFEDIDTIIKKLQSKVDEMKNRIVSMD